MVKAMERRIINRFSTVEGFNSSGLEELVNALSNDLKIIKQLEREERSKLGKLYYDFLNPDDTFEVLINGRTEEVFKINGRKDSEKTARCELLDNPNENSKTDKRSIRYDRIKIPYEFIELVREQNIKVA